MVIGDIDAVPRRQFNQHGAPAEVVGPKGKVFGLELTANLAKADLLDLADQQPKAA